MYDPNRVRWGILAEALQQRGPRPGPRLPPARKPAPLAKPAPKRARSAPKRASAPRSTLAPPDPVEREMGRLARQARYAAAMGKPYQASLASLSAQLGKVPRSWQRDGGVLRAGHAHEAGLDRIVRWKSDAAIQDRFGWLLDPPPLRPKLRGVRLP